MLHDDTNGGVLTNREAAGLLRAAFSRAGARKVDLIFSDTCLNGMVEVLTQFRNFATVIVGSEDLEPGDGWDYEGWLRLMSENPPDTADEWGRQAVEAYRRYYHDVHAAHPCTLAAFRTSDEIASVFGKLVTKCKTIGPTGFEWLRQARDYTQAFAYRDTFDMRDFAVNLKRIASDASVKEICDELIKEFDQACVEAVKLGSSVQDSHGLAFWFPTTRYAFTNVEGTYRELDFNRETNWADYLRSQMLAPIPLPVG